jgi:apolipoprotein N-acyltransferase
MGVFYWINLVTGFTILHFFIIMVYLGLYFGIFGLFVNVISKKWRVPLMFMAPATWVSVEYLRAHAGFMGLPLALLGHTQYLNLPVLQIASLTGAYGISLIMVLANASIADLIIYWMDKKQKIKSFHFSRYNPLYAVIALLLVISGLWAWGWNVITEEVKGKPFSVAVVQGNIPQEIKWNREFRERILLRYEDLSEKAARSKPHLIAWPETSTPGLILKDVSLLHRMISIIRKSQTYFLVGSAEYSKFGKNPSKARRSGNTALFFSPEGKVLGQYIKIRLLPFGEYVPYEGIVPWPEFIVSRKTNFHVVGKEPTIFAVDGT